MRILYGGNVANIGYTMAKEMRKNGLQAYLLMEKNPIIEQDPIKQDPDLKNNYPPWIYFYDKAQPKWKTNIIKKMRDKNYDLIQAHYDLAIWAYLSRRSFIAQIVGDDLRELAFTNSIRGMLLRRAYKKAKVVLFSNPTEPPLLSKLKLENSIFLPLLVELDFFKPQEVSQHEFDDKFVIFHPTNLWWKKGNQILIKGFAEFVKKHSNSILIIVDRGPDSSKIHQLVDSLGIESKVCFVKGPLNSTELRRYYNLADVVADQFVIPEFGLIGRETLCSEKPLLTFYDENGYKNLYGESPPAMNASTSLDIAKQLEFLRDDKIRIEIGKKGRDWMIKHHSPDIISKKIKSIYESVLNAENIDQIRVKLSRISIS